MKRDFLSMTDFSKRELTAVIDRAIALKQLVKKGKCPKSMAGKALALVFEKSSTRTRVSFEIGMFHLGGYSIYLNQEMSQLGRGESYADTARVLSRYVHGIVFRTFAQERITELARYATVPVINGLTDLHHPCQVVADLVTLKQNGKNLSSMTVSYVGDGNNMTHSWMHAAAILGFEMRVACPKGFEVDTTVAQETMSKNKKIVLLSDPFEAVEKCDAVNTDTWFSMGQEVSEEKRKIFRPYQVNEKLLKKAKKDVLVLHCLPAHRGEEITDEVIDGAHSVVFDEAENRLYAQMAILEKLMG